MTNKEIQYNSKLAILVYNTPDNIQWENHDITWYKWIEHKPSDTQGFVAIKNRTIYVVFRGSESKKDFQNDGSVDKVPFIKEGEKVHIGFKSCWEPVCDDVYNTIIEANEQLYTVDSVVVCGHSLGGAIATLMAYSIKNRFDSYHVECCTLGSPRVGNKKFKENFDKSGIESVRIIHNNDLVTFAPFIGYHHVKGELRIDRNGNMKQVEKTLDYIWNYFRALLNGNNIKDHMGNNYLNSIDKWVNMNIY